MRPVLYLVTNCHNGKQYVGVTSRAPERRWYEHKWYARHGEDTKFYRALRKWGEDAFRFEVLESFETFEQAQQAEISKIEELRPSYNSTAGGDGLIGLVRTRQHTENWRRANVGRLVSAEARNNLSKALTGKKKSAQHCANISAGKKGRTTKPRAPTSEAARENMRKAAVLREAKKREALSGRN